MRREGNALPAETRKKLLTAVALNATDPVMLARLTSPDSDVWVNFYPSERVTKPKTNDAIDTFIATYGRGDESEEQLLERLIFNPAPDYSAVLAREEQESLPDLPAEADNSQDALINSFIIKSRQGSLREKLPAESVKAPAPAATMNGGTIPSPAPSPVGATEISQSPDGVPNEEVAVMPSTKKGAKRSSGRPVAPTRNPDDTSLSESLAKIYIKRGRYDKAFEIIHNLSLNNPKKNVYFADQLRFLRKLMLISQSDITQK